MVFRTDARKAFGEEGVACLDRLLNSVREFFQVIPPDHMSTTFVFAYRMGDVDIGEFDAVMSSIATSLGVEDLPAYRQRLADCSAVIINVRRVGQYDLAIADNTPSLEQLSGQSLVFANEGGIDQFVIGGQSRIMPKFVTGARSNFAVATVGDLDEALERYRREASNVSCPILEKVWVGGRNGPRLVFVNRPEATMRRSLERFLSTRIRGDVSVRPEHNTDENRPVDLVVNWFGSKLRALIEVKWLGDSLTKGSEGTQFTSYRDARAQEGADQLVDYIDRERSTDPDAALRGYLAVFDGRRRGVIDPKTRITSDDACYYRERDIVLTRDWAAERSDIAPFVRYYLEPRASLFAQPGDSA